jgi:tetratricopeptide (TPR) repeat protein
MKYNRTSRIPQMAVLLTAKGETQRALETARRAQEALPGSPTVHALVARAVRALAAAGRPCNLAEGEEAALRAALLTPAGGDAVDAWHTLGELRLANGRPLGAAEALRRALAALGPPPKPHAATATAAAAAAANSAPATSVDRADVLVSLAMAYAAQRPARHREALLLLREAGRLRPRSPHTRALAGTVALELDRAAETLQEHDPTVAVDLFEGALLDDHRNLMALTGYVAARRRLCDWHDWNAVVFGLMTVVKSTLAAAAAAAAAASASESGLDGGGGGTPTRAAAAASSLALLPLGLADLAGLPYPPQLKRRIAVANARAAEAAVHARGAPWAPVSHDRDSRAGPRVSAASVAALAVPWGAAAHAGRLAPAHSRLAGALLVGVLTDCADTRGPAVYARIARTGIRVVVYDRCASRPAAEFGGGGGGGGAERDSRTTGPRQAASSGSASANSASAAASSPFGADPWAALLAAADRHCGRGACLGSRGTSVRRVPVAAAPEDVAAMIRGDGIDVLLSALTPGHDASVARRLDWLETLALRPAPVQVVLGAPQTTGASYVDYLVSDMATVSPREARDLLVEKAMYLPHSHVLPGGGEIVGAQSGGGGSGRGGGAGASGAGSGASHGSYAASDPAAAAAAAPATRGFPVQRQPEIMVASRGVIFSSGSSSGGHPSARGGPAISTLSSLPSSSSSSMPSPLTPAVVIAPPAHDLSDMEHEIRLQQRRLLEHQQHLLGREPGVPGVRVLFVSDAAPASLCPVTLDAWATILRHTPDAALVLRRRRGPASGNVVRALADRGVDPDTVHVRDGPLAIAVDAIMRASGGASSSGGGSSSGDSSSGSSGSSDSGSGRAPVAEAPEVAVVLGALRLGDPAAAADAVRLGIPFVALRGDGLASRAAASAVAGTGCGALLVAASVSDYVRLAVALGREPDHDNDKDGAVDSADLNKDNGNRGGSIGSATGIGSATTQKDVAVNRGARNATTAGSRNATTAHAASLACLRRARLVSRESFAASLARGAEAAYDRFLTGAPRGHVVVVSGRGE